MTEEGLSYKEFALRLGGTLPLVHQGKVRDSYRLRDGSKGEKLRLVVVSDRVSIFDFVLGFEVEGKGEILNAFNIAAREHLKREIPWLKHDIIAFGEDVVGYFDDEVIYKSPVFANTLRKRAVVVRELPMVSRECVARAHAAGNIYKAFANGESYCGHEVPADLFNGMPFDPPIFTPTTKAEGRHDEPLDYREVNAEYLGLGELTLNVFDALRKRAREAGIIAVDTKFEFGSHMASLVPRRLGYILADEVFTPDSSRFWDADEYKRAIELGKLPFSLDKQMLREWGQGLRIDKLEPTDPGDREKVASYPAPPEVVKDLQHKTKLLFLRLWGMSLPEFQKTVLKAS